MNLTDFDYALPEELIAQAPPEPRGSSRLLVLDRTTGATRHEILAALPELLRTGDLMVFNNTRVFPARLLGHRVPSGGAVECLLLGRLDDDRTEDDPMSARWEALVHPGQKLGVGERMVFEARGTRLHGEILERKFFGRRVVRLWVERATDADTIDRGGRGARGEQPEFPPRSPRAPRLDEVETAIDAIGHVPLPPYIKRADRPEDRERYQTVYARVRGSVAAPTAGLHFTETLLQQLDARGIERVEITLHVGYGTFKPVRGERVEDHTVDPEPYEISQPAADAINRALAEGRRIVAVGTTTTRALESAAVVSGGRIAAGRAVADLFIYPGFTFSVVSALLTNFHLPRSSLLMLVSAFTGRERVLAAYQEAVARRYRFYSYGDAMLIT